MLSSPAFKLEFHKVLLIKSYNSNQIDTVSAAKAPGRSWLPFQSGYFSVIFPFKLSLVIHLLNSQPVHGASH